MRMLRPLSLKIAEDIAEGFSNIPRFHANSYGHAYCQYEDIVVSRSKNIKNIRRKRLTKEKTGV